MTLADGSKKMRSVQVRLLADEVRDDLEHAEPYGFTSEPHPEAEAFSLFFGGDRSHGIVFCVADRRYRLKPLKTGEVALYDDLNQKVHLTREGIEAVTPLKMLVDVGDSLTAKVGTNASVDIGGDLTAHVSGNASESVDGNISVKVGGALSADVGSSARVKAASVTIDTPTTTITGAVTIQKTLHVEGAITGTGGMAISGGTGGASATVTGNIELRGSMQSTGDVVAEGISLSGHTHTCPDGSTSGPK